LNENGTEILHSGVGDIKETTTPSVYMPYSTLVPTSLQTRVSTFTSTPTTSLLSQTATATTAPSADKPKEGLTTEAKIGIGVGVPAVVIAVLTLLVAIRRS
jgi:hypothetical protein